ncbi:MAG: DUF2130 domain-containing protein [Steroidobacter sp.]
MPLTSRSLANREAHPSELTIACPHCEGEIKLTESLAAPLLKTREAEFKRAEAELREREAALRNERDSLERAVAERLALERKKVADEEQRKARLALGADLEAKQREVKELNELLTTRDAKLAEAQRAQAEVIRKERELDAAKREIELTIEKRVSASVSEVHAKARHEAEEQMKLKVCEKELIILRMQKQLEEMQRKAKQGSQQLQGEVQELELETLLASRFPHDTITPVPKGEFGGDALQRVLSTSGVVCGTILWESKRTKNWSDGWLAKLRQDQRTARADFAVIVTRAMPKEVQHFDLIDGVYVVSPQCIGPVAALLRKALLELALMRQSSAGRDTKAALIYEYLTGPRFRQRIQAIAESFSSMQGDLNAEKKAMQRQWAKREVQLERALTSTAGLFGDVQGIAGKAVPEIEGLGLPALEAPDTQCG